MGSSDPLSAQDGAGVSTVPAGQVIGLIDVRCMYVSCERLINPALRRRPVIVLSNNDGCAVSRSDEAKRLGISLGQPWFELRNDRRMREVVPRSSNYELYGDVSARMASVVAGFTAWWSVYSIDELFFCVPEESASSVARQLQRALWQQLSLPTTVGLGTTKTLAKIASHGAKDHAPFNGLCDLTTWAADELDAALGKLPVSEVWGIGPRLTKRLAREGITTALHLKQADAGRLRRLYSVTTERTARELNGVACLPLWDAAPVGERTMVHSRLFGKALTAPDDVRAVLTGHAQILGKRLRRKGLEALAMTASVSTGHHYQGPGHYTHAAVGFPAPVSSTPQLIRASHRALRGLRPRTPYARATLMLSGLVPAGTVQGLWHRDDPRLTGVVDAIQARYGAHSISWNTPRGRPWVMRRGLLSPCPTTRWADLLTAC